MSPNRPRLIFIKSEPRQAFGGITSQRVQHLTHVVRYLVVCAAFTATVLRVALLKRHTTPALFRTAENNLNQLQQAQRRAEADADALHGADLAIVVELLALQDADAGLQQIAGDFEFRGPLLN